MNEADQNMNLSLCKNHKQEWKQSHYDPHNCDHCRLEKKLQAVEEIARDLIDFELQAEFEDRLNQQTR